MVELRDLPIKPEGVRLGREAARGERVLERAVLGQDLRGRLGADAARAGKLVRGIAAQGDEIRHLLGLDAVALAHLRRADAGDLAHAARGLEDGHGRGGQLERVAVGGRDERLPAAGRLGVGGGSQKVVRLVSGPFGDGEAEGRHQLGQERQLLEQLRVELAPRLVGVEGLVPVGRHLERVPGYENGARLLGLPQADSMFAKPTSAPAGRRSARRIDFGSAW